MQMKVVRAEKAGACYGVQRALDLAIGTVGGESRAYTVGPLIHNPGVVKDLESYGVFVAESLDDVREGTIIIRSHGVTPDVREAIEAKGLPVVDATCPHVERAQMAAAELARKGCRVIVVGEKGHPEVEGLKAYAHREGLKVDVVEGPDDVPNDLRAPIGVVVQTTMAHEKLRAIVSELVGRTDELRVIDTICEATAGHQGACAELAETVDVMVVVGGKNSANTTHLAEIARERCVHTYHIETPDELDAAWFAGAKRIGVTAGASTPENQISAITSYLEAL